MRTLQLVPAVLAAMMLGGTAEARADHPVLPERGIVFTGWWHDAYTSAGADASFAQLAATGANAVGLIATQYQASPDATEVVAHPERTPSDASLGAAVARARFAGLRVRLRVLIDIETGQPRVDIAPRDPAAWFASYRTRVLHYAAAAQAWGVDTLEIGAELPNLSGRAHSAQWRSLVRATRALFDGRLTYGANWNEYRQIRWWDALDEIGVDAYFPLATAPGPTEDQVVAAWRRFVDAEGRVHRYLRDLARVARRFRRQVVFSELGYPSAVGALIRPWEIGPVPSVSEQQVGLAAALRALAHRRWFRGLYVWHWFVDPAAGGPQDTDHTVQGKPALATVAAAFARAARAETSTSIRVAPAGARSRRLVVRGRVHGTSKGGVQVTALRRAGRRWLSVARRRAVLRRGRFTVRVTVRTSGRVRVRASFSGSRTASPSRSRSVFVDRRVR